MIIGEIEREKRFEATLNCFWCLQCLWCLSFLLKRDTPLGPQRDGIQHFVSLKSERGSIDSQLIHNSKLFSIKRCENKRSISRCNRAGSQSKVFLANACCTWPLASLAPLAMFAAADWTTVIPPKRYAILSRGNSKLLLSYPTLQLMNTCTIWTYFWRNQLQGCQPVTNPWTIPWASYPATLLEACKLRLMNTFSECTQHHDELRLKKKHLKGTNPLWFYVIAYDIISHYII